MPHLTPKLQFVTFIAAIAAGLFGLAGWTAWHARQMTLDAVALTTTNLAQALEQHAARTIDATGFALQLIAERLHPEDPTVSSDELYALLRERSSNSPQIAAILVTDAHGRLVRRSDTHFALNIDVSDRDYFTVPRSRPGNALFIGAPILGRASGDWRIPVSLRLEDAAGNFAGVVVATLDPNYFQRFYETINMGKGGMIALRQDDGVLLARQPAGEELIGQRLTGPYRDLAQAAGWSGTFDVTSVVDGVDRIYSYRPVEHLPLFVAVGIAKQDALAAWRRDTVKNLLVACAVTLIIGLIAWRRARAEQAMAESEAQHRILADNAADLVVRTDLHGKRLYVSPASYDVLGYRPAEMLGAHHLEFIHPDDLGMLAHAVRELTAGRGDNSKLTYRVRRKDGSYIWTEVVFRLIRDPQTGLPSGMVTAARDVTARRQAEEQLAQKTAALDVILQEMPYGVQLFSPEQKLVAWNEQLFRLNGLDPDSILSAADPAKAFRLALARRGDYGPGDADVLVAEREALSRAGVPRQFRRPSTSGRWLEVRGLPLLSGGWLGLYRDVTQQVSQEQEIHAVNQRLAAQAAELASARDAAEAANRSKSEFLANMSHELRTPLNAIIGFSELMRDELMGPLGTPAYREYLSDIVGSGTHLLAIINDILDISKIEAGHMELNEEPTDLGRICDLALKIVQVRAQSAALTLDGPEIAGQPTMTVLADERMLRQVLVNLLGNAVKFTPRGGRVSLRIWSGPDDIGFAVSDTGIGIAPEHITEVLQPFVQVDGSLQRSYEGTGLGLPLAKRMVELHGGTLHIASEIDCGTEVIVRLPKSRIVTGEIGQNAIRKTTTEPA